MRPAREQIFRDIWDGDDREYVILLIGWLPMWLKEFRLNLELKWHTTAGCLFQIFLEQFVWTAVSTDKI